MQNAVIPRKLKTFLTVFPQKLKYTRYTVLLYSSYSSARTLVAKSYINDCVLTIYHFSFLTALSFLLPLLLSILGSSTPQTRGAHPRALVLTPTRELAMQIESQAKEIMRGT